MALEAKWGEGIRLYHEGMFTDAARNFMDAGNTAKLKFNVGICHAQNRDFAAAMTWFQESLKMDPYLVVGHAWLGFVRYYMECYEDAIASFTKAIELYNINDSINYTPLGLDVEISKAELLFNRAICHYRLCEYSKSRSDLLLARPRTSDSLSQVISILLDNLEKIERSIQRRSKEQDMQFEDIPSPQRRSGSVDYGSGRVGSLKADIASARKFSLPISPVKRVISTRGQDQYYENNTEKPPQDMELMHFLGGGDGLVEYATSGVMKEKSDDGSESKRSAEADLDDFLN